MVLDGDDVQGLRPRTLREEALPHGYICLGIAIHL